MNIKLALMFKYHDFIKTGDFYTARKILYLLNHKKIDLGLNDTDWLVEETAYRLGLKTVCLFNGRRLRVYLKKERRQL